MARINLTFNPQDLRRIQNKIKSLGPEAAQELDAITKINALEIERNAKRGAPVDTGKLRQGITAQKVSPGLWLILGRMFYTAYQEFGTITKVNVPAGLEALAIQFKGKGIRTTGGIKAKLFMYKAWVKQGKIYKQDLETALKRLAND